MLRRNLRLLHQQPSSSSSSFKQQQLWNTITTQTRSFKPPALHVLLDTATNHRFSVATIDLTRLHNRRDHFAIVPDSKAAFLLYDTPAEFTNETNFKDPVPVEKDSVAFVGLPELITTDFSVEESDRVFLDETVQRAFRPCARPHVGEEKLVLTELDLGLWFGKGGMNKKKTTSRDVIMRNLEMRNKSNPLKIVCSSDWADALTSQDGLEAFLESKLSKQSRHSLLFCPKSDAQKSQDDALRKELLTELRSPLLPKDSILPLNPGDTFNVGKREMSFAAETWCSCPIFEDLSTRSLFSSSGLAGFIPWMELFSTPMFTSSGEYLPLLSSAMRSHPPFVLPFYNFGDYYHHGSDEGVNTTSTTTTTNFSASTPFDARTSVQLVQYLLQRSPQRIFLQRFGMVSPADEFLEKLEINAIELVDLQQRLARKLISSSSSFGQKEENRLLIEKTTERLMQCFLIGFNSGSDNNNNSSNTDSSSSNNNNNNSQLSSLEARFDSDTWNKIKLQREMNTTPELNEALDFVQNTVEAQLTEPFILGAQHLAAGNSPSVFGITTTDEPENESLPKRILTKSSDDESSASPASSSSVNREAKGTNDSHKGNRRNDKKNNNRRRKNK